MPSAVISSAVKVTAFQSLFDSGRKLGAHGEANAVEQQVERGLGNGAPCYQQQQGEIFLPAPKERQSDFEKETFLAGVESSELTDGRQQHRAGTNMLSEVSLHHQYRSRVLKANIRSA